MSPTKLQSILNKHKLWLNDEEGGERADLSGADLSGADLRFADLRDADLRGANLSGAVLSCANLSCADIDYSCLPLWCGSLSAHFDDKHVVQIIYHAVKAGLNSKNTTEPVKNELEKLINLANQFHRVDKCGRIEEVEQNENKGETNHEQNNQNQI